MKSHSFTTRSSFLITTLSIIILIAGCHDRSDNEPQTNGVHVSNPNKEALTKKAIPPRIDIHTAVISDDYDAIKQHILAGTDINQKDPFGGSSPLISAALFDKKDMVALLIDAGAELNFQNNDGSTALHTAAFFCRPEIVQLLLDKGANKSLLNNRNSTAFDLVSGPFDEVKPIYDYLGQSLAPFGLVLDYSYLQATRPMIMALLN